MIVRNAVDRWQPGTRRKIDHSKKTARLEITKQRRICPTRILVELVTEDNHILELLREHRLLRVLVVPELSFPQEVEPGLLHHPDCPSELIGTEKDGCAENAFKGCD